MIQKLILKSTRTPVSISKNKFKSFNQYPRQEFSSNPKYDVIVIGGGHAGCEAAYGNSQKFNKSITEYTFLAASRLGSKTLLVSQKKQTIGEMSCNPSIGGIGKGTLVREIDALGGMMGFLADLSGIQFQVLNSSQGVAVQGPRAQIDRDLYKENVQNFMFKKCKNLQFEFHGQTRMKFLIQNFLIFNRVNDLLVDETQNQVMGVKLDNGKQITSQTVILTTGTFLRGVCYRGGQKYAAGRHLRDSQQVEPPSVGLAQTLEKFKFPLGRLKTGTPPRLKLDSVNLDFLTKQSSDLEIQPFSFINEFTYPNGFKPDHPLIDSYLTYTNPNTHKIVQQNISTLPIFQGKGGLGQPPRYCPSIQTKVTQFFLKPSHQIWLEKQGLNSKVIYPNGLSTSFPEDVQLAIVRSIQGLDKAEILRAGYSVQYDFVDPRSLHYTLETRQIANLFLAGQINGTTGYEEAACQGIIAGINAGLQSQKRDPFILNRTDALTGVLIDDLISFGASEPYRMFTSRSEFRLVLRAENSDFRLTPRAIQLGLVTEQRQNMYKIKKEAFDISMGTLQRFKLNGREWKEKGIKTIDPDTPEQKSAFDILQKHQDGVNYLRQICSQNFQIPDIVAQNIETQCKYEMYFERQLKQIEDMKSNQLDTDISMILSEDKLKSLCLEQREILLEFQPNTLYSASKLRGIRPNTLTILYSLAKKALTPQFDEQDIPKQ